MQDDLEPQAAARVGQLTFAFARLDFLLALALRNLLQCPSPSDLDPLIERLGFKDRLDSLREIVNRSKSLGPDAVIQFEAWYERADRLRATRNAFVHGRWGMQTRDTLFNASTKVGKALTGESKTFSLAQLDEEVSLATQVLNEFHTWHGRAVRGAA